VDWIADPDDESLQECSEDGQRLRAISRKDAHAGPSRTHMAVHVLVERPSGALILQKRSRAKRIDPGLWDSSVGGHVLHQEDLREAALRETEEELGIRSAQPQEIYRTLWRSEVESEFVATFHLIWDGPVTFPVEEIEAVQEWTLEAIRSADRALFTQNFLDELERFERWKRTREES
jgi:isopentenyldiphosphate isomerase